MNPSDITQTDNDHDIDQGRRTLHDALAAAATAITTARQAVSTLASDGVYDVEIAEGDLEAITAALTSAQVAIAATSHLTRHTR